MSIQIGLARLDDDAALRRLAASNAVPGNPPVIYAREPGYFLACSCLGPFWQVIALFTVLL